MSAPEGRHSLAGMTHETRAHRRDMLQARLDETGTDPVWLDIEHGVGRDLRLGVLWQRTGPGRRDRWAAAIAQDLTRRDRVNGMSLTLDGVEIELNATSAAELDARQPLPVLVPPPPGLLRAAATEVERAVREAEEVLGE